MDPVQLLEFVKARKWVAVAAIIIFFMVRLLKSDTKIPINIPPWLRFWTAIAFGGAAGALDKLTHLDGVTWTTALLEGVTAAVFAVLGHNAFIGSLRGGKEILIPGLIKENTPPGPGKPPSIPPSPMNEKQMEDAMKDVSEGKKPDTDGLVRALRKHPPTTRFQFLVASLMLVIVMNLAACKLFTPENLPNTLLTFEQIACIMQNAFIDDKNLNAICNLLSTAQQDEARRIAGAHRASVQRQLASRAAEPVCDGGAPVDAGRDGAVK